MTCLDNHAVGYTVLSVCRSADISGDIFLNPFRNFYVLSPSSPELSMYKPVSLYLFITGDDPILWGEASTSRAVAVCQTPD